MTNQEWAALLIEEEPRIKKMVRNRLYTRRYHYQDIEEECYQGFWLFLLSKPPVVDTITSLYGMIKKRFAWYLSRFFSYTRTCGKRDASPEYVYWRWRDSITKQLDDSVDYAVIDDIPGNLACYELIAKLVDNDIHPIKLSEELGIKAAKTKIRQEHVKHYYYGTQ